MDTIIIADGNVFTQLIGPAICGYIAYWFCKEYASVDDPAHTIVPLFIFWIVIIAFSMKNNNEAMYGEYGDGPPDTARKLKYEKKKSNNICLFSFTVFGGGFIGMSTTWGRQREYKLKQEKEAAEKESQENNN